MLFELKALILSEFRFKTLLIMENPSFFEPLNPRKRNKHRSKWHDYREPCIYMITITKKDFIPLLSSVEERGKDNCFCNYSPVGYIIYNQINAFNAAHKEAIISHRAIMPDHIHLIIEVKEYLEDDIGLGRLIGNLKDGVYKEFMQKFPESKLAAKLGIFEYGFNDMILRKKGQLDRMINYIKDNPRKYIIKKRHPDLFSKTNRILINNEEYMVIGNIFLLRNPDIEAVRYSRKYELKENEGVWETRKASYRRTMDNGGVLVSPFINPKEKDFLNQAIDSGTGIILIQNRFYGDRDKPGGRLFDLCARGQLLIISINKDENSRDDKADRQTCLFMNDLAAKIAYDRNSFSLR